jgi:hypothetical protein
LLDHNIGHAKHARSTSSDTNFDAQKLCH